MTTLFIALKLLWRRKLANIILLLQVLISVAMLAQMYVYIVDHLDNVRAVSELPVKDTFILHLFDYYTPEYAAEQLTASSLVQAVGTVDMGWGSCNDTGCTIAVYNDGILQRYAPELQSGSWLNVEDEAADGIFPAVVSQEIGLRVGETGNVRLTAGRTVCIRVIGTLKRPTQYLYPSGSASPAYFAADSVISQDPAILLRARDTAQNEALRSLSPFRTAANLFIFLRPETTNAQCGKALEEWNRYGEITPAASLVATYKENTHTMIAGGIITFGIFLALAVTSILSSNVIQALRNRKLFTVYYLLGMDWKQSVYIEATRSGLLLLSMMALIAAAGQAGLLMLEWLTPARARWFYGIAFLYILLMFASVGTVFIWRLTREDLSTALKDLQQGE